MTAQRWNRITIGWLLVVGGLIGCHSPTSSSRRHRPLASFTAARIRYAAPTALRPPPQQEPMK